MDADLIPRIAKQNDTQAFRLLFNHYYDRLLKSARYFSHSNVLAEEIVSDVFVSLWKNRKTLPEIDKLEYYLSVSVKRKALDYLKQKRAKTIPMDATCDMVYDSNPEKKILYKEFESVVQAAVSLLPPKCRLVYEMAKNKNLKCKEIAVLLDISEVTVKFHIGKALSQIRETVRQYLSDSEIKQHLRRLTVTIVLAPVMLFF